MFTNSSNCVGVTVAGLLRTVFENVERQKISLEGRKAVVALSSKEAASGNHK